MDPDCRGRAGFPARSYPDCFRTSQLLKTDNYPGASQKLGSEWGDAHFSGSHGTIAIYTRMCDCKIWIYILFYLVRLATDNTSSLKS